MLQARSRILHYSVGCDSVSLQLFQDIQYHIFPSEARLGLIYESDFDGLRDFEPRFASYERHRDIGYTKTNSQTGHRASGASVRIGAND